MPENEQGLMQEPQEPQQNQQQEEQRVAPSLEDLISQAMGGGAPVVQTPAPDPQPDAAAPPVADPTPEPPAPEKHTLSLDGQDIELTMDELRQLAEHGAHTLARDRQPAPQPASPFQPLLDRLQTDAAFAQHVLGYQPQAQQQASQSPPDDPIERIKWEAVQQASQQAQQQVAPLMERLQAFERHQRIEQVRAYVQTDPLHAQVMDGIRQYVSSQPEQQRRAVFQRLDTDPEAFLSVYGGIRGIVAQGKAAPPSVPDSKAQAAPQAQPQDQAGLRIVQKPQAPKLESPGGGAEPPSARVQQMQALKKKIQAGQVRNDTLENLLNLSGVFASGNR